ncbi:MAG: FtsW/RodA/SpoVE family cell cycle protein [Oscillospiraceae bacterium]|nr:FtsW/RodA/SpoVE family cell cycle protein [Oscillospiraceae bacterium]
MEELLQWMSEAQVSHVDTYIGMLRYLAPLLAAILLWRCLKPMLTFRQEPEIWAWIVMNDGKKYALTHWENVIGRSKSSDVCIDSPAVSRNHAVLTRYDDGSWSISDANSKNGVMVNDRRVMICALEEEDVINIGGIEMRLLPVTKKQEVLQAQLRTRAEGSSGVVNLLLLTILQCLICLGFLMGGKQEYALSIVQGFGGIVVCQWALLIFYSLIRRSSFDVETVAFFLCTMGMAVIASQKPHETNKQLFALMLGIVVFLVVGWSLRDLERAKRFRYLAVILGVGFLVITLLIGEEQHGAKAWIRLAGMTIQPSELSKVCFVYAGASTMDRLMNKRNLILFIGYSIVICGCLALMNDFGTALIFFAAFLVIAYMRSGSVGTVGLACTSLGFAGVIAVKIAPHALRRFTIWRHIWEDPYDMGFQQTRAIMCLSAGGLFGLGAGRGLMRKVFAADSDVIFASVAEEWGLVMALMTVICIAVLAIFSVRTTVMARSSFYAIGGCTAAAILVTQTILNVLGTVDVLPLTGVTFPFLSNGGSSMIGAWGLLAFIKAADTRQNASFAVRTVKKERGEADE